MIPLQISAWSFGERQLLEEVVIPSPHSVELEGTAFDALLHRLTARQPHVAELYHENSKLTPAGPLQVDRDPRRLRELRDWYFETAYAIREDEVRHEEAHRFRVPHDELSEELAALLRDFRSPGPATDRLYAVDLLVLEDGRLLRVVPLRDVLWIERSMEPEDVAALRGALQGPEAAALADAERYLFLVACPWRYMLLYGPRGYRSALLDAGRLLCHLDGAARKSGAVLTVAESFYDHQVDRILHADGVERSTLAVAAPTPGDAS